LGLAMFMYLMQSRYIYFPTAEIEAVPSDAGLDFEDVVFETADGLELAGWFVPSEKSQATVLFCHGNGGNISHRLNTLETLNRLGLSVFIFDYRGYGRSRGRPTEEGTYLDVTAAWEYLLEKKNLEPSNIVVIGRSLGGAIASWLAKEHTPGALVVESSFTSVRDMAARLYPLNPLRFVLKFRYETIRYIPEAGCPVLVVHSRNDELIPFDHGQKLFEAARAPKMFLETAGAHNEWHFVSEESYASVLDSFISEHIRFVP